MSQKHKNNVFQIPRPNTESVIVNSAEKSPEKKPANVFEHLLELGEKIICAREEASETLVKE